MEYELLDIDQSDIQCTRELCEANRSFREEKSQFFFYEYRNLEFSERMKLLFSNQDNRTKITIAKEEAGSVVGYCLSTLAKGSGEIATLFVDPKHRHQGIGRNLLEVHLQWFDENECQDISVRVLAENESAIELYKSLGFQESLIHMAVPIKRNMK